jgi:hypothetical protein
VSRQKIVVIFDDRERVDPLWYLMVALVLLETIALFAMAIFFSNPLTMGQLLCALTVPNLINTAIGSVLTALVFRKKDRQGNQHTVARSPTLLTTTDHSASQIESSKSEPPQLTAGDEPPAHD